MFIYEKGFTLFFVWLKKWESAANAREHEKGVAAAAAEYYKEPFYN